MIIVFLDLAFDYVLWCGLLFAVTQFITQLSLCLKVKRKLFKLLPILSIIINVICVIIILIAGGESNIPNPELLLLGVCSIVIGMEILGNLAAWLTYGIKCFVCKTSQNSGHAAQN